ncbi:telomere length regulation protein-domain-containing protein [Poronia punctata]|nr:telomere length regulation protein-domain-containing protein [Poronia punctata]
MIISHTQQSNFLQAMSEFLTPVRQIYTNSNPSDGDSVLPRSTGGRKESQALFKGGSPEEALEALRAQPDFDALLTVLKYLQRRTNDTADFDIRTPSSLNAQIVHVLVTEIVPNYWPVLQDTPDRRDVNLMLACLRSLPGINATLAYLRSLIRATKSASKDLKHSHLLYNIAYISDLLSNLLDEDGVLANIWKHIASLKDPVHIRPLRNEFLSLLTSGKIISVAAEAEDICRQAGRSIKDLWVADNKRYIIWLAHNLVHWTKTEDSEDGLKLCSELSARAMRLGHSETLVRELFNNLLLRDATGKGYFVKLVNSYPPADQRKALLLLLKLLSDNCLDAVEHGEATEEYPTIWGAVSVLRSIITGSDSQRESLVTWLTSASGAGIGQGYGVRRAAVAALADQKDSISQVLEKSLGQFGEQLYIKHSPILQQEAHAQVLLLSAGYVQRIAPMKLTILLRSSAYLNAISNRLAVSQSRARFLGMVVGEALSGLVHANDTKLNFQMDETSTEEANWYKSLVHVNDQAGPLDPLRASFTSSQTQIQTQAQTEPRHSPQPTTSKKKRTPIPPVKVQPKTGFIIEEVEDDEDDGGKEDPDLIPYAKPDSDAEDSDDDPTLINRDKPKAPVYIRDLISFIRDTDNYDKQKVALATAPALIRRKASYGTEVSSHAEELASLLIGLPDKFNLDEFDSLRLQGMIAVVVAQPKKMAPWFAKTFFDGDYSLSQRASILVVLGLSGREIAGFDVSEYASAAHFPSKALPSKVEKHYLQPASESNRLQAGANLKALPPNALDSLARSLSQMFLAPMAAEAADAVTGPDALKLSSFTSRLQQQQQPGGGVMVAKSTVRSKAKASGTRSIPNTTASVISSSFFFPLSSRFQVAMRSSASKILFQPYLLALYLKTLAVLIHAAGPSTIALPQMTAELWDLLLSVRGRCLGSGSGIGDEAEGRGDMAVTHAVLLALAALLDVNEDNVRELCERQGRQVVETMEWVGAVFENTRGSGGNAAASNEENSVKMLAAGILIRLREAVDKYQAVLMGDLIGFT